MKNSQLLNEKIAEVKDAIARTKVNEDISKNTRSTTLYRLSREVKVLELIAYLLPEDKKLEGKYRDTFVAITTLQSERASKSKIEVNEGDSILELLDRYSSVKNLTEKLKKAADDKDLKLDYSTGTVVSKF